MDDYYQRYDDARDGVADCGISFADYTKIEAILKLHLPYVMFSTTFRAFLCDRELIEHYFEVCKPSQLTFEFHAEIRQYEGKTEVRDSLDFVVSKEKLITIYYNNLFSNESVIAECSFDNLQAALDQMQISISKTFYDNFEMSFSPTNTLFIDDIDNRTLIFGDDYFYIYENKGVFYKLKAELDGELDAMLFCFQQGLNAGLKKESVELMLFIQEKFDHWCIENKDNADVRTEAEKLSELICHVK